jgi:hypothetical protein
MQSEILRWVFTGCVSLFATISLWGQVNATFDGRTFSSSEVRELQISSEKILIRLFEVDMDQPGAAGIDGELLKTLGLIVKIEFPDGVKFPIVPQDSLICTYTYAQLGKEEYVQANENLESMDVDRMKSEGQSMASEKQSLEQAAKAISEKLMNGEISPDEAAKQMEALSAGMLDQIDNSYVSNMEFEETERKYNFDVAFYNTYDLVESRGLTGRVYLRKCNENEVDLDLSGVFLTTCFDGRFLSSEEAKEECTAVESSFYPGRKALREGEIRGSIRFDVRTFLDNR